MKQLLVNGYFDALPRLGSGVQFNHLGGGALWSGIWNSNEIISSPGTISNLAIKLDGAPGTGDSWAFVLQLNGSDTAITITISDDDTTGQDTSNSVSVVAGDLIIFKVTHSGTPAIRQATWSAIFEGTNARESIIFTSGRLEKTGTRFVPLEHAFDVSHTVETTQYQVIPTPGVIKNLYVAFRFAPGTGTEAFRITLRKNGVSTDLAVTITGTAKIGNNTTDEIPVVAGDLVNIMIEPLNSPTKDGHVICGTTFLADTDGESLILGGSGDTLDLGTTEYNYLRGSPGLAPGEDWGVDERNQGSQTGFVLSKLYVWVSTALSGDYVITLRAANADTSLAVTISSGQTGSNISSSYLIQDLYEYLGISCLGLVTAAHVHWGLVQTAVGVVTTYPSDPATRITELITRYTSENVKHPFTSEILLGGATFGSLSVLSADPPTEPEMTPEPDTIAPPVPPPPGAASSEIPSFTGLWDPDTGKEIWWVPGVGFELREPEEEPPLGGGGPAIPI